MRKLPVKFLCQGNISKNWLLEVLKLRCRNCIESFETVIPVLWSVGFRKGLIQDAENVSIRSVVMSIRDCQVIEPAYEFWWSSKSSILDICNKQQNMKMMQTHRPVWCWHKLYTCIAEMGQNTWVVYRQWWIDRRGSGLLVHEHIQWKDIGCNAGEIELELLLIRVGESHLLQV